VPIEVVEAPPLHEAVACRGMASLAPAVLALLTNSATSAPDCRTRVRTGLLSECRCHRSAAW